MAVALCMFYMVVSPMAASKKVASKGGRPRLAEAQQQSRWLQIRIDEELDRKIDERVVELRKQGLRVDRSSLARQLLRQSLSGSDSAAVQVAESMQAVRSTTERVVKRLLRGLPDQVASALDSEMQRSA